MENITITSFLEKNNSTENISDYIPYKDRPETYIVPALFFIIFVIGIIINGTIVIIFVKHPNMRNVPNTYIFSLALADLLVIITNLPFTSIIYTLETWPWSVLICKLSVTVMDIFQGVSIFTLVALSSDRFFAIVNPLENFHTNSGGGKALRTTLCITASIWVISILFAIPAAVGAHIKHISSGTNEFDVCYPFPEHWLNHDYPKIMVMTKFCILYMIPLIIIAIFYVYMAVYLILSTKHIPGEIHGTKKQIRARKQVAVTVLIFVLVFAVCFLPTNAFLLFFYFYPDGPNNINDFWHYFRIVGFCLCYINSCANPVALYLVSGTFRNHFNRYLFCKKPKPFRRNTFQRTTQMSLVSTSHNYSASFNRKPRKNSHILDQTTTTQETSLILFVDKNESKVINK